MSFNEKNTKHVTQLFHYNLIIFIVLRCLNCFCMVINHLKSMKYILIIISFINTTLWKLAKLRGITPLYNSHSYMATPSSSFSAKLTFYERPPPPGFWFLRLGVVFSCLFYLIFFWLVKILDYMSVYDPTCPTSKNDAMWLHAWEYKQVLKQRKILCPWNLFIQGSL